MVMMTLYVRQQKRHRCIEQSFGLWERVRVGWFRRMALKHVNYHMGNRLPVQVQCMRQGAWGWCTGMTQRDGMGSEVGGAFKMGNTCTLTADSCQCMAKPLQYCKVIKINKFIFKKHYRWYGMGWVPFSKLKENITGMPSEVYYSFREKA